MIDLTTLIDSLNAAWKADPDAILDLIEHRTSCNRALADHPTVQVAVIGAMEDEHFSVSTLGLLNAVVQPLMGDCIAFRWNDDGTPLGFCVYQGAE